MDKKLIAEFLGTFTLALGVVASIYSGTIATQVLAAMILGVFVYSIGWLSGCHINPAVTLGLLLIKRIKQDEAVKYILAQLAAGLSVLLVVGFLGWKLDPILPASTEALLFEFIGMILFTFGIGMVAAGKVSDVMSGVVVGTSLFLGLSFALMGGAAAILNPAVAVALRTTVIGYYVVDILGALLGFQLADYLSEKKPWWKR